MAYVEDYYGGAQPIFSPEYLAYRDRVQAGGGFVFSQPHTQGALDVLAAQGLSASLKQWLDCRFGRKLTLNSGFYLANVLYNLGASSEDATADIVRACEMIYADAALLGPVIKNGTSGYLAGNVQALAASDNYTWGMKYWLPAAPIDSILYGNRNGSTPLNQWQRTSGTSYVWVDLSNGGGIQSVAYTLPATTWGWLWVVKNGAVHSVYNESGTLLATKTIPAAMGPLPFALGCGPTYESGYQNLRFQTMVRFATALTLAQRNAIQSV
jgi:hypothetical protein